MLMGIMGYNSQNDRYGLLVMDLWEIDGFHCGDTLEVWDSENEQWIATRMEMHWNSSFQPSVMTGGILSARPTAEQP